MTTRSRSHPAYEAITVNVAGKNPAIEQSEKKLNFKFTKLKNKYIINECREGFYQLKSLSQLSFDRLKSSTTYALKKLS